MNEIANWSRMMSEAKNEEPSLAPCYGDFTPTEKDRRLYELARQYHAEAEAYDQSVCTGRNERGIAIPVNSYELVSINRNALKIKERLLRDNPDIARTELNRAISRHAA